MRLRWLLLCATGAGRGLEGVISSGDKVGDVVLLKSVDVLDGLR